MVHRSWPKKICCIIYGIHRGHLDTYEKQLIYKLIRNNNIIYFPIFKNSIINNDDIIQQSQYEDLKPVYINETLTDKEVIKFYLDMTKNIKNNLFFYSISDRKTLWFSLINSLSVENIIWVYSKDYKKLFKVRNLFDLDKYVNYL